MQINGITQRSELDALALTLGGLAEQFLIFFKLLPPHQCEVDLLCAHVLYVNA
jgi:hypothetical protein